MKFLFARGEEQGFWGGFKIVQGTTTYPKMGRFKIALDCTKHA